MLKFNNALFVFASLTYLGTNFAMQEYYPKDSRAKHFYLEQKWKDKKAKNAFTKRRSLSADFLIKHTDPKKLVQGALAELESNFQQ